MTKTVYEKKVTGNMLKCIACITMLIDHVDIVFLGNDYSLRCIGRIAFPIFIFLLAEGFIHTHNKTEYLLRLIAFSLISEIPYDLIFNRDPFFFSNNSVMWTLTLGFICLIMIDDFWRGIYAGEDKSILLQFLLLCGCLYISEILDMNYGATGIMAIILCYIMMRSGIDNTFAYIAVVLLLVTFEKIEIWGLLGLPAIIFYSGELGKKSKPLQLAFYLFYPVHLTVLYILSVLFR